MSLWVAAPAHAVTLFDGVIFVDDFVLAFGGDDSVNGQSGDDFLDGDTGTNRLDGGAGIDECVNGPVLVNCEW